MRIKKIINESEVLEKYQSGMTIDDIRKQLGVTFYRIRKIISSRGLEITSKPKKKITDDDIRNVALQYGTRYEFRTMNNNFYCYAFRRKILDDVCSHMKQDGNRFKRMVYAYEFSDNCVYVGLTYNKEKRNKQHIRDGRGPVYKHIQNTGIEPKFIMISDYIEYDLAQKMEKEYIERYKNNGWTLLNSKAAGALGGNFLKWSEEKLKEESLKYETRREMEIKNLNAYSAIKRKKMNHLFSHMKWEGGIKHTLEECLEEAKKYKTRKEFREARLDLYRYTIDNKWGNIIYAHMKKLRLYKLGDTKDAVEISKKYKTLEDFKKNDYRAYRHLLRHKDYTELTKHLERKK